MISFKIIQGEEFLDLIENLFVLSKILCSKITLYVFSFKQIPTLYYITFNNDSANFSLI